MLEQRHENAHPRFTCLVLVFISNPDYLQFPKEQLQVTYFASLRFQVAYLKSY